MFDCKKCLRRVRVFKFDLTLRETDDEWFNDLEMALKAKLVKYGKIDKLSIEKESNCV